MTLLLSYIKRTSFFSMDTILTLEFLLIFLEIQLPGDTDEIAIPLD